MAIIMTVLFIILGVLMVMCGFSCMFTPLLTYINTEYIIATLVMVFGIFGIIKGISAKRFGPGFVFSIISAIFGILVVCLPNVFIVTNSIFIYMLAAWIVLEGIVTIITSVAVSRLAGGGMWILQLIIGILAVIIGGYTFVHPLVLVVSIGILIGIFFVETGITMIVSAAAAKE